MRKLGIALLLFGCGGDSSGDASTSVATCPNGPGCPDDTGTAASTSPGESEASASSSAGTSTTTAGSSSSEEDTGVATFMPMDSGDESMGESGTVDDCAMAPNCASCWQCAERGPCMNEYQNCASMAYCTPSLTCVESQCTADGLMQGCVDTCCMSCTMLGTCGGVDSAITCIETVCAGLCGMVSCP